MSANTTPLVVPRAEPDSADADKVSDRSKWKLRRDIPIAILAWTAVAYVIFMAAGHISRTILLLAIAALLAYALAPGVKLLQRYMPRFLAILIVYLVVLVVLGLLLYLIVNTAIEQVGQLSNTIRALLTPSKPGHPTPLEQTLYSVGFSPQQITNARNQLIGYSEGLASSALPIITSVLDVILDIVLVAVISIYLLIDGSRIVRWVRRNAPRPERATFVLDTLQRIVGGYIRGQLLLCALIGVLVGGVTYAFGVPYALLLGVLAFVLESIPIIGTLISGAICVLLALTRGWPTALGVLIAFCIIHVIEGDVVGPRIVGKAVGLHPVVSLAALVAGGELFGIWGALFASPVAGVIQTFLVALWDQWRKTHPEEFARAKEQTKEQIDKSLGDNQT